MKTVLQNIKTGEVTIEDVPPPILKSGHVLVLNRASLVSAGTEKTLLDFSKSNYLEKARKRPDLVRKVINKAKNEGLWQTYKAVNSMIEKPFSLGYSSAGIVVEVGSEVADIKVGQKVACAGMFLATHSEVVSVPRNLLVPVDEEVSFEEASFVTIGAIAIQSIRLAELQVGENVVVYGLGLIGNVVAQIALASGCKVIGVDLDSEKIKMIEKYGGVGVLASEGFEDQVLQLTNGFGADKVIMALASKNSKPMEYVPIFTRQKGVLVVLGDVKMDIPRRAYYDKEIDIKISRSYGPGRYDYSYEMGGIDYPYAYVRWTQNRNMEAVIDLIKRKKLDVKSLISHRFTIEKASQAYDLIDGKIPGRYIGVVIEYPQRDGALEKTILRELEVSRRPQSATEVKVGLIGAGNFARVALLPAFSSQKEVKFETVCTATGVSAQAVAKKYNALKATSHSDEIFSDPEINAVIITTRHDSHADYIIKGLRAGKAVFVEKPLAITEEELERIKSTYLELEAHGKEPILMVGFNRRFSPLAKELKNILNKQAGPKSIIYRVNAGFIPPGEWLHDPKVGGGRLIGEACHFVDLISFLVDSKIKSVQCTNLSHGESPSPDTFTLTVEYESGSLGTVHYFSNGNKDMEKEYLEAFCGGVSAKLFNFKSLEVYGAKVSSKTKYWNQKKGYDEEAQAFVQLVLKGGEPPISFESLYQTTLATIKANQAMAKGSKINI